MAFAVKYMRRIYFLAASILLFISFFSCKKDNGKPYIPVSSQNLIVGKWVLQSEHSVEYIDGVKKIDTIMTASQNSYADLQFNSNGTFTASGMYAISGGGSLSSGASVGSYSATGTYSFAGSNFSFEGSLLGFESGAVFGTTTAVPVITPVSHSTQVTEVTTTNLVMHTEVIYTYTLNNVSQTYKLENDLSYTR